MPTAPNTTSLAVDREVADQVRAIATELNVSTYEVTNQLLRYAMQQEVEIEVKRLTVKPKAAGKKSPAKRSK